MTITISNLTVAGNAPAGTTVGMLTALDARGSMIPCNYTLTKASGGYFAISANNLITAWMRSIAPGYFSVRVRANGINTRFSGSATFIITVGSDTAAPTPTSVTFTPTAASLPDNAAAGTIVAAVSVSMSDGSAFSGTLVASPAGTVMISGNKLALARALAPADDGSQQWAVTATQNGVTVSGAIQVQVIATPTGVIFTPTAASLPDNAAAGTVVAAVSVSMSDGSAFAGTLAASPAGTVTISGNNLVLARGLTAPDDGSHQWGVAATQNGVTVSGTISVQVTATPTGVTFTPTAPSLPDNAATGTTVAAVSVSMSDGSAFSGTLAASPAGTVTISGNKLVLARGLTPADDGSRLWSVTATQNGVTVSGIIPVQVTAAGPPPPSGNQLTTDDGSAILTSDNGSFFLMVS